MWKTSCRWVVKPPADPALESSIAVREGYAPREREPQPPHNPRHRSPRKPKSMARVTWQYRASKTDAPTPDGREPGYRGKLSKTAARERRAHPRVFQDGGIGTHIQAKHIPHHGRIAHTATAGLNSVPYESLGSPVHTTPWPPSKGYPSSTTTQGTQMVQPSL